MNISNFTRKPFFFDTTLRDGNQALNKPWNIQEKEEIFKLLLRLGVQAIEVGYPGSNNMDFEACKCLAGIAPKDIIVTALARARADTGEIDRANEAIKDAPNARVHLFVTLSPFHMENVLHMSPEATRKMAVDAVKHARRINPDWQIQFSPEHFGMCKDNLPFVIDTLKEIVAAGATTINLPNTVERTRPSDFVALVKPVREALPENVTISVHCHNDLGMATATTVESYFAGANQLECTLNGLGERTGNTNVYEVAVALHNCGENVPLDLGRIHDTAQAIAVMSGIPIAPKAPIIGTDCFSHKSGLHQNGVAKTLGGRICAYEAYSPELIGKTNVEHMSFTSQSGCAGLMGILSNQGITISKEQAASLMPELKHMSEKVGTIPPAVIAQMCKERLQPVLA